MKKIMLKVFFMGLLILVIGNAAGLAMAGQDREVIQLRVGGATSSSWIYSALVTIAEEVKQNSPYDWIVQATPGSTSHYGLFKNGELDLGSGYTPTDYWAIEGTLPGYEGRVYEGDFYTLAPVTASFTQVAVRADSSIQKLEDLKGEIVFVGEPGAASTPLAWNLIKTLGLDIKEGISQDLIQGYEMLGEGRVAATFNSAGVPYSLMIEYATKFPLRLIPFSDEEIKKMVTTPYNSSGVITSDAYSFVKEPVQTLKQIQTINISPKVSDEVAYELAKVIWESWENVVKNVPACGLVSADDIVNVVAPIHPGAIKYYEEQGIQIPDKLRP